MLKVKKMLTFFSYLLNDTRNFNEILGKDVTNDKSQKTKVSPTL